MLYAVVASSCAMRRTPTSIPGCIEYQPPVHLDSRGSFAKVFQRSALADGEDLAFDEIFWSRSKQGVLRGLHFQLPPHEVVKLVWCTTGRVFDVVVDLRTNLPSYGHVHSLELDAELGNAIVIPSGCAHGFLTVSNSAVVCYAQSREFDAVSDAGILWSSVPVGWPLNGNPIVSDRDADHPPFDAFVSPFRRESPGNPK